MRRVEREKRHLRRWCPMSPGRDGLCMGEACKWSVGGECAVALLARNVGGGADGGVPEAVDRGGDSDD